jgi:ferredoxin--NADP+ reductase
VAYKILSKTELCPNQYELVIDAPYVVRNAKAGQFIILRAEENGERVPLTIADVDKENGKLTIVFMAVGYTTKKLAEYNVGDELVDLVGPLGKPTHIENYGTVVCLRKLETKFI